MNKDIKNLELLYEQVVEDNNVLLDEEKQFAKEVSEKITPLIYESIASRIINRGKLDHEYLSCLIITPDLFFNIFGSDRKIVESAYRSILFGDVYSYLVYVETINNKIFVCFRKPEAIYDVLLPKSSTKFVHYKDKEQIEQALRETIENTILIRYKLMTDPKSLTRITFHKDEQWVDWRKEKLKFYKLKKKLPEFEGIL